MKKFLAALLALSLTFGSVALPATESGVVWKGVTISASAETYGDFEYDFLDDGTIEITKYTGDGGNVVIPSTINGKRVTRIGDNAFFWREGLTGVTIPNSITSIGSWAFNRCTNLTNITIPESVTSIDSYAFEECSSLVSLTVDSKNQYYLSENGVLFDKDKSELLSYPIGNSRKEYKIPESVVRIDDTAFQGCTNLTNITIPNNLQGIGSSAFYECSNLASITIPASVTGIGDLAFYGCTGIASITVDSKNEYYSSENGVIFNKDKSELILYPATNSRKEYNIPSSVTCIDRYAFYGCTSLANVTVPGSVIWIRDCAFYKCSNLESVKIDNGVKILDSGAFEDCTKLTSVMIPSSITEIKASTFYGCTSLTNITIPDSVTSIGDCAFYECSSLTNITIPDSVTSIGSSAFERCSSLASITIPNSITTIEHTTFYECTNLRSITIPNSVTTIEYNTFDNCTNLKNVYYTGSADDWANIEIGDYNEALTIAKIHYNYDPSHIHSYTSSITKQPTCTEDGIKTFKCSECGDTYTETIPATGHTEVIDKAVPATCTTDGKTAGSHCSVCGKVIKAQKVIKATGHKFGSWSTTKSATCTENGTQTRKCSACGKTETKTIPATGHKSSNWIVDKPAAIGVKGSKHKECTVCGKVLETAEIPALSKQNISSATVKLSATSYTYNGKAKKPSVKVKLGSKTLKNGTDYTVSYSNNKNIGTATVKIVGKGDYAGTIGKTFKISPVKMSISKLRAKSKAFKASWAKNDKATGYEIQYGTDSKFKSAKKVAITKKTTTAKTITKLKAKKKYFVRMRIYTTVNGKKYYGAWSAVKTVTTKK